MKIQVTQPCHEKWEAMNPTQKGAFCLACQTEVVDFTKMSDSEIKQYFQKNTEKTCGRFLSNQLDRNISPERAKGLLFAKWWVGLGLCLGIMSQGKARNKEIAPEPIHTLPTAYKIRQSETTADTLITIKGKVLDKVDNEPIPGAIIKIKNQQDSTLADVEGNFKLSVKVPSSISVIILEVSLIGYAPQEVSVNLQDNKPLDIRLEYDGKLAEVVVTGYADYTDSNLKPIANFDNALQTRLGGVRAKPSSWQRFKNIFRRKK